MSLFRYRLTQAKKGITDLIDYVDGLLACYDPHEREGDIYVLATKQRLDGDPHHGVLDVLKYKYRGRFAVRGVVRKAKCYFEFSPFKREKQRLLAEKEDGRPEEELAIARFFNEISEDEIEYYVAADDKEDLLGWYLLIDFSWSTVKEVVGWDVKPGDATTIEHGCVIQWQLIEKYAHLYPGTIWEISSIRDRININL